MHDGFDYFTQVILPIITAMFLSGGFWEWLQSRKGSAKDMIRELRDEFDKDKAERARTRILRFDDELRMNVRHSIEYFDDILRDINSYTNYCNRHADFKNAKAVRAIEHIQRAYDRCHEQNDFL